MPFVICVAGNDKTPITGGRLDKYHQTSLRTLRCDDQVLVKMWKSLGFEIVKGANKRGSYYKEPLERTVKFTFLSMPKKAHIGMCSAQDIKEAKQFLLYPSAKTPKGKIIPLSELEGKSTPLGHGKVVFVTCVYGSGTVWKTCKAYEVNGKGKASAKTKISKKVEDKKDDDNSSTTPPPKNGNGNKKPVEKDRMKLNAIWGGLSYTHLCLGNPLNPWDSFDLFIGYRRQLTENPKYNFSLIFGGNTTTTYLRREDNSIAEFRKYFEVSFGGELSFQFSDKVRPFINAGVRLSNIYGWSAKAGVEVNLNEDIFIRLDLGVKGYSNGVVPQGSVGIGFRF